MKKYQPRPLRIAIERFVNLNIPAQDKFDKANSNVAKWTIFINNKHTLAHIVPKGEEMWVRVRLHKKLRKESDLYVEQYMFARMMPYLIGV